MIFDKPSLLKFYFYIVLYGRCNKTIQLFILFYLNFKVPLVKKSGIKLLKHNVYTRIKATRCETLRINTGA